LKSSKITVIQLNHRNN